MLTAFIVALITIHNIFLSAHNLKFILEPNLNASLQVNLPNGTLQGREFVTSEAGVPYLAFQGIPYAKPPLGNLRFRSPRSIPKWDGVLDASRERSVCIQLTKDFGSEDCLFLNIYTPRITTKHFGRKVTKLSVEDDVGIVVNFANQALKNTTEYLRRKINDGKVQKAIDKLPVIVFIYGGAFVNGYSNKTSYGPDYLLEQSVVFVSFNYRVGVFGFLSTEDLECPGNFGLKDQIEALAWIQRNIEYFGGDPGRVTILGQSAGAACVNYLMMSSRARGLFQSAIAQSGSALCPWSLNRDSKHVAHLIGLGFRILSANTSSLLDKLRTVDAGRLNSIALAVVVRSAIEPTNGLAFSPVIEPEHEDAVITSKMHEQLKSGKYNYVPLILGFTSQEGSVIQDYVYLGRPYLARWDLRPNLLVPSNMHLSDMAEIKKDVGHLIKTFYFGNKYIATSSRTELVNYIGDSQFVRSIRETALLCSRFIPVYLYQFSYQGLLGRYGVQLRQSVNRSVDGVGHVEDLWYIFKKENLTSPDATDANVRKNMVAMWTNFAKFGNPTPIEKNDLKITWPLVNENNGSIYYLNIDAKLDVKNNPRGEAMKFWDNLYKTYGHPPYDNY